MSDRASLINTPLPTVDREELERARLDGRRHPYVEIAVATNRIPIPWLACFKPADLQPVTCRLYRGPAEFEVAHLQLPCVSVEAAKRNLESSLQLYEAIYGSGATVHDYWQRAIQGLGDLPFEFLSMQAIEVLANGELAAEVRALVSSLGAMPERVAHVKHLSSVQDGFQPYTAAEYFEGPSEALDHAARVANSAAMDPGYSPPEFRMWFRPEESKPKLNAIGHKRPWWKRW
jgi:hypothetical protein